MLGASRHGSVTTLVSKSFVTKDKSLTSLGLSFLICKMVQQVLQVGLLDTSNPPLPFLSLLTRPQTQMLEFSASLADRWRSLDVRVLAEAPDTFLNSKAKP